MSPSMLWGTLVATVVVTVVALLVMSSGRRRDQRSVGVVADRLAGVVSEPSTAGSKEAISGLERSARAVLGRLDEAEAVGGLLRAALDGVPEAVVVSRASGEIVLRNRAAVAISGDGASGALVDEAIESALADARSGEVVARELSLYGPPRRELFLSAYRLQPVEEGAGALVIVEDVSSARRVDSVRRDFVANVSHELRTPIGAVVLLGETIAGAEEAAVRERLAERIVKEAERLGRIVDDLLDLSAIEADATPSRDPVPVREIVSEAAELVRGVADAAGTTIGVTDSAPGVTVAGDRRRLVGALANLLENAVKYSDSGSQVEVSVAAGDGTVSIAVSDQGYGIPSRHLERVFERFYRVDRARSRESGGQASDSRSCGTRSAPMAVR
ncbi:MAG: ATP-binding protein [Acidimicrobiia bacterium]|nr:ATP-binding protein [Acidimicrobiia bacterium]